MNANGPSLAAGTAGGGARLPMLGAWFLYVCFVVYGSLVPLEFQPMPAAEAWKRFEHIGLIDVGTEGRADWIANGVLYAPVGFLTAALLAGGRRARPNLVAMVAAFVLATGLALAIEYAQVYFPPRTVSLNDLVAELIGSVLGIVLARHGLGRLTALLEAIAGKADRLAFRLLEVYAIAYVGFAFFPFDFLLSGAELRAKLASDTWGWFLAPQLASIGTIPAAFKVVVEVAAAVPLGLLWGRIAPAQWARPYLSAMLVGVAIGLAVEAVQMLMVSGVAQGLSVLTRPLGVLAGVLAWHKGAQLHPAMLAARLRRFGGVIAVGYLLALFAVNGWFDREWKSLDAALNSLGEVRFLPFYYHYFTTEQIALMSLVSICVMYAPFALLTWAALTPPRVVAAFAAVAAAVIESGKLFLRGLHPDPTNLLIAGVATWLLAKLLLRLNALRAPMGHLNAASPVPAVPPVSALESRGADDPGVPLQSSAAAAWDTPSPASLVVRGLPSRAGLAVLVVASGLVAWGVASFPFYPVPLGIALALYAVLLWQAPAALLVVVPVALALLDLAHWSGRFFVDEFDLVLAVSLAVAYARIPAAPARRPFDPWFVAAVSLLGLSFAISAVRGMLPLQLPDAMAFAHYYSPYNALRLGKGVLWAVLLYGILERLAAAGHDTRRLFARGLVAALVGVAVWVIWERSAFPGLLNLSDVYRVTGPVSHMNTGGAEIETLLTVAVPFLVLLVFDRNTAGARALGLLLLVAATYAVMVTYSRAGYAGYAAALAIVVFAIVAGSLRTAREWLAARAFALLVVAGLALATAVPVFKGEFAQVRLGLSEADLGVRKGLWSSALAMRDPGLTTAMFGMGLGRFPATHFWRSESGRAGTYAIRSEDGNAFLRIGSGGSLYVEQFVALRPEQRYVLAMKVRSKVAGARASVTLCEKWLLTSAECVATSVVPDRPGEWRSMRYEIDSGGLGAGPWYAARPVKLSLAYGEGPAGSIDFDQVSLRLENGAELVANGDFAEGMDLWFYAVDDDRPWHIWSMPVQIVFDQGFLGVAAFTLLCGLAVWRAARQCYRGDATAGAAGAAIVGFLAIGALHSHVDSPRMLLLLLLLAWFCCRGGRSATAPPS